MYDLCWPLTAYDLLLLLPEKMNMIWDVVHAGHVFVYGCNQLAWFASAANPS